MLSYQRAEEESANTCRVGALPETCGRVAQRGTRHRFEKGATGLYKAHFPSAIASVRCSGTLPRGSSTSMFTIPRCFSSASVDSQRLSSNYDLLRNSAATVWRAPAWGEDAGWGRPA